MRHFQSQPLQGARARGRYGMTRVARPTVFALAAGLAAALLAVSAGIAWVGGGDSGPGGMLGPMHTLASSGSGSVTLQEVDGGSSYYSQFSNPLPSDRFPIGVWGSYNHTQANRDLDAAAGLNTYVWVADSTFMGAIRADGRFRVIQSGQANVGPETAGWLLGDEPDMSDNQADGCPSWFSTYTARADGRLTFANYGKGLALPGGGADATQPWRGDGANGNWWSSSAEQSCFANGVDVASVDMYWFTDPWQAEFCCGYKYGDNVRNLRNADAADGSRHPNWGFVETGEPWGSGDPNPKRSILPNEIRSATWHQLIAGARGVIYFQHSFGGPCVGDHHTIRTNCEGTRPMVTALNAQINRLAPVLNAPFVTSGWTVSPGMNAMMKWANGHFYVFAASRQASVQVAQMSIPCVGNATAVVEGESRSVPVSGGSFSDTFADGNAVHIYRIDGGSTCGLPSDAGTDPTAPPPAGSPMVRRSARIGRVPRRVSLRSGRLVVTVVCVRSCTARSRLTMRRAHGSASAVRRRILLAASRRRFGAGRHRLVLRLSARARRRVARARKPLPLRLRTIIVQRGGGGAERTQYLVVPRR